MKATCLELADGTQRSTACQPPINYKHLAK